MGVIIIVKIAGNANIQNIKYGQYRHVGIHAERSHKTHNENVDEECSNLNIHLTNDYSEIINDEGPSKIVKTSAIAKEKNVLNNHLSSDLERVNRNRAKHGKRQFKDALDYAKNVGKGKAESMLVVSFGSNEDFAKIYDDLYSKAKSNNKVVDEDDFKRKFLQSCSEGLANYAKGFNQKNKYVKLVNAVTNVDENKQAFDAPHIHMQLVHTGYKKYNADGTPADDAKPSLSMNDALKGQYPDLTNQKDRFSKFREDETNRMIRAVGKQLNHDFGYKLQWQKSDNKGRTIFHDMKDYKKLKQAGIDPAELEHELTTKVEKQQDENQALKIRNRRLKQREGKYESMVKNYKDRFEKADKRNHDLSIENKAVKAENDKLKKQLEKQQMKLNSRTDKLSNEQVYSEETASENRQLKRQMNDLLLAFGITDVDVNDPSSMDKVERQIKRERRQLDRNTREEVKVAQRASESHSEPRNFVRDVTTPEQPKTPQYSLKPFDEVTPATLALVLRQAVHNALDDMIKHGWKGSTINQNFHWNHTIVDNGTIYTDKPLEYVDRDNCTHTVTPNGIRQLNNQLHGNDIDYRMLMNSDSQWRHDEDKLKNGQKLTWADIMQERREYRYAHDNHMVKGIKTSYQFIDRKIKEINDKLKQKAHEKLAEKLTPEQLNDKYETGLNGLRILRSNQLAIKPADYPYIPAEQQQLLHKGYKRFGVDNTQAEQAMFKRLNEYNNPNADRIDKLHTAYYTEKYVQPYLDDPTDQHMADLIRHTQIIPNRDTYDPDTPYGVDIDDIRYYPDNDKSKLSDLTKDTQNEESKFWKVEHDNWLQQHNEQVRLQQAQQQQQKVKTKKKIKHKSKTYDGPEM